MGYAFISYSNKNRAQADALHELFAEEGIQTWMAPYDIPAGAKYAQTITAAIRGCGCMVLLLSEASQSSEAVDSEVELAVLTFKKSVIAAQIEELELNDSFLFYLHNKQIIPVREVAQTDAGMQKVLDGVTACVGRRDIAEDESDGQTPLATLSRIFSTCLSPEDREGSVAERRERAEEYVSDGGDCCENGDAEGAVEPYCKAIALFRELFEQTGDADSAVELLGGYSELGAIMWELGRADEAKALFGLVGNFCRDNPDTLGEESLSIFYNLIGLFLVETEDLEGAKSFFEQAVEQAEILTKKENDPFRCSNEADLARKRNTLGDVLRRLKDWKGAEEIYLQAISGIEYVWFGKEREDTKRRIVCESYVGLGDTARDEGDLQTAAEYYERAEDTVMAAGDPENIETVACRAAVCERLGDIWEKQGDVQEAGRYFDSAVKDRIVLAEYGRTAEAWRDLYECYNKRADFLQKIGDVSAAIEDHEQANRLKELHNL